MLVSVRDAAVSHQQLSPTRWALEKQLVTTVLSALTEKSNELECCNKRKSKQPNLLWKGTGGGGCTVKEDSPERVTFRLRLLA